MRIGIIIPVHDGEEYLRPCLNSVLAQVREGDVVVVVDDRSTDSTVKIAEEAGASVFPNASSNGPYGARATGVGVLGDRVDAFVFFDMRCVALPGWLESHRDMFEGGAGFTYSGVEVARSATLAGRLARSERLFAVDKYLASPEVHFPMCNLGVQRGALEAVGGISVESRGGGDAELCWRLQAAGYKYRVDSNYRVSWHPRSTYRALMRQFHRYGSSAGRLSAAQKRSLSAASGYALLIPRVVKQAVRDCVARKKPLSHAILWMPVAASFHLGSVESIRRQQRQRE